MEEGTIVLKNDEKIISVNKTFNTCLRYLITATKQNTYSRDVEATIPLTKEVHVAMDSFLGTLHLAYHLNSP